MNLSSTQATSVDSEEDETSPPIPEKIYRKKTSKSQDKQISFYGLVDRLPVKCNLS